MAIVSMHGEFCTALDTTQLISLNRLDLNWLHYNPQLDRVQGNE